MKKLIVMRGLPGAGKSTVAETLIDRATVRVNKDLLREMLHCKKYSVDNEVLVRDVEYGLTEQLLEWGYDVILDGTHLGSLEKWEDLADKHGAQVVIREVNPGLRTAIEQDKQRGQAGGRRVGAFGIIMCALFRSLKL